MKKITIKIPLEKFIEIISDKEHLKAMYDRQGLENVKLRSEINDLRRELEKYIMLGIQESEK